MQKRDGVVLYSASDLVNYLECEHLTSLDLIDLETPLPRTQDSDEAQLIQSKGYAHEANFLEQLKGRYPRVIDIAMTEGGNAQKVEATLQAMRDGYDIIFQATLKDGCLIGHADFLRKVNQPSKLGAWRYEVLDTKLSRTPKAKFIIQLAFYSAMVAKAQGAAPQLMHVVLGDKREATYRFADYARYLNLITRRFLARVQGEAVETYPNPCEKCAQCKWRGLCEERRLKDDHLSQVANITRLQVKKLELAGVKTLEALAKLPVESRIPKMPPETLAKLHQQARLQWQARETGVRHLELLPEAPDALRGFARLPAPAEGDLFFDMEGDPLEEGGLEYLFGLYYFERGEARFKAFWAHSRAEEKVAFEAFMDFVTGWLRKHPNAFIYHYAAYEQTALKKLMSLHGTREAEVDNLLRTQKLVDLYKVVREAIRVSEPKYSIKNIEHFYLEGRTGDVKNAGASIVFYERWKETGDTQLLKEIEDYNHDDVRSTYELRQWLLSLRPAHLAWFAPGTAAKAEVPQVGELTAEERRLIPYRERLVDRLPTERSAWGEEEHLFELTYQLLDFHRRAAKPEWWSMFSRKELSEEELLDDGECLAGLIPDTANPPTPEQRSVRYSFFFPEQESKLKSGDSASIAQTSDPVSDLEVDEARRHVSFKLSAKRDPLSLPVALGPGMPVSAKALTEAVFRFADSLVKNERTYTAIEAVLTHALPAIKGHAHGTPILTHTGEALPQIIQAISNLEGSYIFVQGPPGAGKTYTGSHVIVSLLKHGYKVGVSSNSHKAINNLLHGIERVAKAEGFSFRGAKKSTKEKTESHLRGEFVQDVSKNGDILDRLEGVGAYQLVAGTAWLFADADMDQRLDYIFVDEAGQVALANLVAMGTSARNIVLLGDQMQLGQPIQGVHPGRSGESSLEYLLNGKATIPAEQGIFLEKTWRMHPDVCRFISDAVYDGRLEAAPHNANQTLLLNAHAHPALKPTGIRYLPVQHDGCSQRSEEEAALVRELVTNLLDQHYRDKKGNIHPMTLQDILVVAPYNMQVNLLKKTLPEGARVGTVDKFQGQEAEVVIVSMATSNGDYLPRFIEFLYSKNRLNVAISRAKCLAVFLANPALMAIHCSTPEEMALVNTLCWVQEAGQ
ncbi:TM0106 family RecB-like putative nuclease [Niveibacterium sp. 24ML]|uniref:TM0106 family RecB-like putative nuclease n=1 Tax=Niveibacterium sp. 24ML TaxID=2985512 RepID=UPI00226F3F90|nr:TM0106 family RecB-like putative nuclease [Niveibacterium sp. 24ML]MCX9154604.1 TM0106 family RecB-like putative nuclease [Niveibacterium sp. 24ML]